MSEKKLTYIFRNIFTLCDEKLKLSFDTTSSLKFFLGCDSVLRTKPNRVITFYTKHPGKPFSTEKKVFSATLVGTEFNIVTDQVTEIN